MNNNEFQKLDLTNVNQTNSPNQVNNNVISNVNVVPDYKDDLNNVISSNDAKKMGMGININKNKAVLLGILGAALIIFLIVLFIIISFVKTIKYAPNHEAKNLRLYIPNDFVNSSEGYYQSKSKVCSIYGGAANLGIDTMKKDYEDNMFTTYGSTVEWNTKMINGVEWSYAYNSSHTYSKDYYMYLYNDGSYTYMVEFITDTKLQDDECSSLLDNLEKSMKIKK